MDTQEPLAETIVSPEPIMEEEVTQGKEGEANIHEHAVQTIVTQEPTMEIEAYLGKNDIQKFVDKTDVT